MKNVNTYLIGLIIILLFILGGGYYFYQNKNIDLNIANQNIIALNDTITIEQTKKGELIASKAVLVTKNKDLKDLNLALASEVKDVEGRVIRLTTTVANLRNKKPIILIDSIYMSTSDSLLVKWGKNVQFDENNYRNIQGYTSVYLDSCVATGSKSTLTLDEVGFSLTTGLREENGKIEIFVKSGYPGFSVTKLDGAEIDPAKNPIFKNLTKIQ